MIFGVIPSTLQAGCIPDNFNIHRDVTLWSCLLSNIVWGSVILCFRMDYTGERGYIHVPQMTARQLMNQDVNTGTRLRFSVEYNIQNDN